MVTCLECWCRAEPRVEWIVSIGNRCESSLFFVRVILGPPAWEHLHYSPTNTIPSDVIRLNRKRGGRTQKIAAFRVLQDSFIRRRFVIVVDGFGVVRAQGLCWEIYTCESLGTNEGLVAIGVGEPHVVQYWKVYVCLCVCRVSCLSWYRRVSVVVVSRLWAGRGGCRSPPTGCPSYFLALVLILFGIFRSKWQINGMAEMISQLVTFNFRALVMCSSDLGAKERMAWQGVICHRFLPLQ